MRLLITGGAGFIGSAIVDAALSNGWDVRVLDSLDPQVHPHPPRLDPGVELMVGNATDAVAVGTALAGIDAVCHQSAKVGLGISYADAPDYIWNNDFATAVLLAGMEQAGIGKLVLASSMVVYGEGSYLDPSTGVQVHPRPRLVADLESGRFDPRNPDTDEPLIPAMVTESSALDPRNVYAASKVSQEHLASAWARATGGEAIALRYHNVYGPLMPKNTPYAGVASIFRSAIARGEAPQVFEDGLQRRSFIHVRDIASANICALEALQHGYGRDFGAYNVGADTPQTIGDVATALSTFSDAPAPVVTGRFRLGDVRHITASSELIKKDLAWRPLIGFDEGMREFALAPLRGDVE